MAAVNLLASGVEGGVKLSWPLANGALAASPAWETWALGRAGSPPPADLKAPWAMDAS